MEWNMAWIVSLTKIRIAVYWIGILWTIFSIAGASKDLVASSGRTALSDAVANDDKDIIALLSKGSLTLL